MIFISEESPQLPELNIAESLLQIGVPPDWYGHLAAFVLPVDE